MVTFQMVKVTVVLIGVSATAPVSPELCKHARGSGAVRSSVRDVHGPNHRSRSGGLSEQSPHWIRCGKKLKTTQDTQITNLSPWKVLDHPRTGQPLDTPAHVDGSVVSR